MSLTGFFGSVCAVSLEAVFWLEGKSTLNYYPTLSSSYDKLASTHEGKERRRDHYVQLKVFSF